MNETQAVLLWVIPLFLVFFAGLWLLVTGALGELGGWGELGRLYREPEGTVREPVQSFGMASLDLRRGELSLPVNYGGCVVVEVARAGLHLRTWLLFRFRHPPLLIPWSQIDRLEPGRTLFFRTLTLYPRGVSRRVRLYGGPAKAVEQAAQRLARRPAQPAGV